MNIAIDDPIIEFGADQNVMYKSGSGHGEYINSSTTPYQVNAGEVYVVGTSDKVVERILRVSDGSTASQTAIGEYNHLETDGEIDIMVVERKSLGEIVEGDIFTLPFGWTIYTRINTEVGENDGRSQLVFTHNGVTQSILTSTAPLPHDEEQQPVDE